MSAAENSKVWGATPREWDHFCLILGLEDDLLPVVSNPQPPIAATSKLADKGKVPSLYTKDREITGLARWTSTTTTPGDIKRWAKEPDYGICVQTRVVRAIDGDITDPVLAVQIRDAIDLHLGFTPPCRVRGGASKFLYAVAIPGVDLGKRTIKTAGGIIEFLANGQQFVAVGTHNKSGTHYEWLGGLPLDIPELTVDEFESLWAMLVKHFAIEVPTQREIRKKGEGNAEQDDTLDFLDNNGWVKSYAADGRAYIQCPFEHEHTSDSGETATAYFPRGLDGFEQGHFKCLHAHCESRADADFLDAIGERAADFDVIATEVVAADGTKAPLPAPLPAFERDKNGNILATIGNVVLGLRRPDMVGFRLAYDQFRDEVMMSADEGVNWRAFTDADYVRSRIQLEKKGFKPIGRELCRDGVLMLADECKFDSAILWAESLEWDGVCRVERFNSVYLRTTDTPYTRAVALYMFTAMAGRCLDPGCKADMAPIWKGLQGAGKSTAVRSLVPSPEFFTEIGFHEKDDDLSRKMRGRLVAEIGELKGLHSREQETIKAFITRTHEDWVPKYREFNTIFPRRLIFIGTTNKDEFLADETGNRRWLPVDVGDIDIEAIRRDCLQLWAEGIALWRKRLAENKARGVNSDTGVMFEDAEKLAIDVHSNYLIRDSWADDIATWLDEPYFESDQTPRSKGFLQTSEVLKDALRFESKSITRAHEMRVATVLRSMGFNKKDRKVNGRSAKVWVFGGENA